MRAMTLTPRFQVRRFLLNPVLTLVLFLLAGYGVAQTANDNWISTGTDPTSEDWFTFGNWSLQSPPQSGVNPAFVTNGGTADVGPTVGPSPPPPPSAVSLTVGQIGGPSGSKVIVDGNGATLSVDNQISVQNGELDVRNGGAVSFGSLTIGEGGLVSIGTSGKIGTGGITLNGGQLLFGSATISNPVDFSGSEIAALAGQTLTINGTIAADNFEVPAFLNIGDNQNTGSVILNGRFSAMSAISITISVNAGKLIVNDQVPAAAFFNVASGAALGGTGTIQGPVTIQNGGILSPGNAPGTLTVGSLTLNPGSVLNYRLGRPNVVGGGVSDLVQVNGKLTLAGTLNITNVGGFGKGVYRLFNYTGTLSNNGLTIGNTPQSFTSRDFIVQTNQPGQINLVVAVGGSPIQFWDGSNTKADGTIHGGPGVWDNVTTNWTNSTGDINLPWQGSKTTNSAFAVFAGPTGGTVTLGDNIAFNGMQFMTSGYAINGKSGFALIPVGNPVIRLDSGISATINVDIANGRTGSSSITKTDAGTLTLSGNNSYQGGTTITGGTLIAASNTAFGTGTVTADAANSPTSAPSKIVVNSGLTLGNSFVINDGASLDNSGAINSVTSHIGAASIVNRSDGTIGGGVLLSGSAGNSVQLFSGSAIQGNLNLGNNSGSQLIFDGSGNQLLSQAVTGNITNAGSLTKQGTGTWTVDKALAAPVSVDVVAGKLEVNSTLTSASVTVQNGATISGSGLITGNLTALGTISPGHSPGTLTLNGNYTQGPSGLLNIVLASPTNFSRLAVGGHAALDGTLRLTLQGGFVPTNGSQFTILTTGKGISGGLRNVVSPQGQAFRVSYAQAGIVQLLAGVPKPPGLPIAHISDGTPSSTTEMMADLSFFSFSSLAGRMAADTEKANAISIAFDAGEFRYQGHRGEIWGFPISGQRRLTDRMRLDYQIPLQYLDYPGAHLFQSGLILELPTKIILPSENHPWTWDCKPTVMVGASGSKEVIGGGALTNVITYRWNDVVFTYANYIGFFEGDTLANDDVQFNRGVDQQIMKNGLRVSIPIAKRSWLLEAYGVYTQSFQSASVPSYATIGVEIGRHFVMNVEGRPMDLGFFSLGFYSDIGNHYNSGHIKLGSGWRF